MEKYKLFRSAQFSSGSGVKLSDLISKIPGFDLRTPTQKEHLGRQNLWILESGGDRVFVVLDSDHNAHTSNVLPQDEEVDDAPIPYADDILVKLVGRAQEVDGLAANLIISDKEREEGVIYRG